jgi:hypothetical protein
MCSVSSRMVGDFFFATRNIGNTTESLQYGMNY